jgi:single-strand DNA-binding protein
MSNSTIVIGNLSRDPELRYTPQGKAVVTVTIADTPRNFDRASGQWSDGVTDWVKATAWEDLAENIAATLKKGDKVIGYGSYKAEKYEDKTSGEERSSRKLVLQELSPSLTNAVATVEKKRRNVEGGQVHTNANANTNSAPSKSLGDDETPF